MSPRTFVTRGTALVALALGIAACETKTIVSPPPADVQVQVTPSSASLTAAGQTVQYVALVTGVGTNGNTAVTWKSSNTAVATVAASGNTATVTAVANGTASIIATSVQDPTRSGAAIVTVNISTGGTVAPPTVSIASITTNAGTAADVNNIQGAINVTLNVDVPSGNSISSVNWLLDGTKVCSQTFSQGKSAGDVTTKATDAVTMTCQINTAAVDATGKPVYANGSHQLSATLVGPSGTTQASTSQTLVFNNTDQLTVTTSTTKGPQTSDIGTSWVGGDLTVTVTPAIFSGSANNIARVAVTLTGMTGASFTVTQTDTVAPFTVTFPAASSPGSSAKGVKGVQDSVRISITSITTSGQQGPSFTSGGTNVLRLDNAAPKVTKFKLPTSNFINGSFAFGSTGSSGNFAAVDSVNGIFGVDRVTVVFQAAPQADTSVWKTVTTGADLAEVSTPTYIVKAIVTDALGNTATFYANSNPANNVSAAGLTIGNATAFAVDLTVPTQSIDTASTTMTPAGTANAFASVSTSGQTVRIAFSDTGKAPSGPKGIQYKIIQFTAANGAVCLSKDSNGNCVFGTGSGSGFSAGATQTSGNIPVPSGAAYDSIYVQTLDLAGNASAVIPILVLQDGTPPAVGGVQSPSVITGGTAVSFSTSASDNVDLGKASATEAFGATLTIFAGSSVVGTFGLPLETSASPAVTLNPFITSIELASALGTSTNASAINFTVSDQVGQQLGQTVAPTHFVTQTLSITPNVVDQSAFTFTKTIATGGAGVTGTNISANNTSVCNNLDPSATGLVCGTVPTTTTVKFAVAGPSGIFANPFTTVYFYADNGSGISQLIGTATSASASDDGTTRIWTYSFTWNVNGLTSTLYTVRAIGVDTKGHGLVSNGLSIAVNNAAS